ncbi:MAG: amidohydrolase family protein, partial [Thermoleophilia bacterium]|nr:amidohydrolase family protein [Thermoleophilia bacterium]
MNAQRLWNARVIDPETGVVIENGTVAWADGLLTDVSEARGDAPEGAVDLEGKAVLPGLIDAHVHLISDLERSPGFGPSPQLHGEDTPPRELGWELVRTAEGGLGSMDALAAATSGGSAALGLPERGRLAAGAAADIVVVDGDPLAGPRVLLRPQRIWLVIRDGEGVA